MGVTDFQMQREMRILGEERRSAQPTGSPLDTPELARCGGKEKGLGGAGRGREQVGWIVVAKEGAMWVDAVMVGVGKQPQRLFGLHSLLKFRSPSAGIQRTKLKLCAQARLPWGRGKSIFPCGFHRGRKGPHPTGNSPKPERSWDAGKPINDQRVVQGERHEQK